jgi:hypothetical protein
MNIIKSIQFKGKFTIELENSSLVNGYLRAGSRVSIWKDETNFTAAQIEKILNESGKVFPGETVEIEFSAIDTQVTKKLEAGDVVFWGAPYTRVGTIEIHK